MNSVSGRTAPARRTRSPGNGWSPARSRRTSPPMAPCSSRTIGISTPRSGSTQTAPCARTMSPIRVGQRPGAGIRGRIAQLGGPLLQRIAVASDPLREDLVHQRRQAVVGATQRAEVLHVVDEAPRPAPVDVARPRGRRCGAPTTRSSRGSAPAPRSTSWPRQHPLGERLDRQRDRPARGSPAARRATKPMTSSSRQRLTLRQPAGHAGLDAAGSPGIGRSRGCGTAARSRPSRAATPPGRAGDRPAASRPPRRRRRRRRRRRNAPTPGRPRAASRTAPGCGR